MIKKFIMPVITLLLMGTMSYAAPGDLGLIQSLSSGGANTGGVRIDLGNGFVTDISASLTDDGTGTSSTRYDYWADLYYGSWGVMIGGGEEIDPAFSVVYAIEQSITDSIILGIYTDLVTVQEDTAVQSLSIFDAYLVLSI